MVRYAASAKSNRNHRRFLLALVGLLVLAVVGGGGYALRNQLPHHYATPKHLTSARTTPVSQPVSHPAVAPPLATECSPNTLEQNLIVSISQRHLWACSGSTIAYQSAVITGMENLPADLTPVGTYHIYAKYTDRYLTGHDSTGSWNDYVYYWMPWLHNQYGNYGFHDATWRTPGDFGNISPYSSQASHGCVELPLATAKWVYDWAVIGTPVTIES
jgi:hypothetical protein